MAKSAYDLRAGRRTVLKAGLATAWTVPVVQVVTAAPAAAVSGQTPPVLGATASVGTFASGAYPVTLTITNSGQATTDALRVQVKNKSGGVSGVVIAAASSGTWHVDPNDSSIFIANSQLAGSNGSMQLQLTSTRNTNTGTETFNLEAQPGSTGTSSTAGVTLPTPAALSGSANVGTLASGTYPVTLTITNNGQSATDALKVQVTNKSVAGTTVTLNDAGWTTSGGFFVANAQVAPGGTKTLTLSATRSAATGVEKFDLVSSPGTIGTSGTASNVTLPTYANLSTSTATIVRDAASPKKNITVNPCVVNNTGGVAVTVTATVSIASNTFASGGVAPSGWTGAWAANATSATYTSTSPVAAGGSLNFSPFTFTLGAGSATTVTITFTGPAGSNTVQGQIVTTT